MIDPAIWDDPDIGTLSRDARLLFIGCFSLADDFGNILADPRYLKKKLFGYDDVSVAMVTQWLDEVIALRSITPYVPEDEEGQAYLHLNNWTRYQKLDSRYARRASCPPYEEDNDTIEETAVPVEIPEKCGTVTPQSLAIERDAALSKVNISKESKVKKNIAATPPLSSLPEQLESQSNPEPAPLTKGQLFFLEAFSRKRFATIVQKQAVADIEAEVGLERWQSAVTWAARNNIRNLDSMITAARSSSGGKSKHGGKKDAKRSADIREWEADIKRRQAEWDVAPVGVPAAPAEATPGG